MPRRCRGIRGDVGIAPYGRFQGVRCFGRTGSSDHAEHNGSFAVGDFFLRFLADGGAEGGEVGGKGHVFVGVGQV